MTNEEIDDDFIAALLEGVFLDDEPGIICASSAEQLGPKQLKMSITTGKYHQVKRMIVAAGNHVNQLHRIQVGAFCLPADLAVGAWRNFEP